MRDFKFHAVKHNNAYVLMFALETQKDAIKYFGSLFTNDNVVSEDAISNVDGFSASKWDFYKLYFRNKAEKTEAEKQIFDCLKPYMKSRFSTMVVFNDTAEDKKGESYIHELSHCVYDIDKQYRSLLKAKVNENKKQITEEYSSYYCNNENVSEYHVVSEFGAFYMQNNYYTENHTGDNLIAYFESVENDIREQLEAVK